MIVVDLVDDDACGAWENTDGENGNGDNNSAE
jgi:hypothetical protein